MSDFEPYKRAYTFTVELDSRITLEFDNLFSAQELFNRILSGRRVGSSGFVNLVVYTGHISHGGGVIINHFDWSSDDQ